MALLGSRRTCVVAEEKFDPYHAWLGIPAWDRPVNAYRLLGLEVFEENRKVIEAAANRQMAYLQELSSGDEHIDLAQKLLGQISRARVVLLNPEKKIAYDQKLNAQLDTAPETAATSDDYGLTVPSGAKPRAEGTARANKSHPFYLRLIRPAIFMLVGLAVILTALAIRKKPTTVRVYEDKDGNGSYDKGEGVAEMNVEGFATSADGSVSFSLPAGTKELRPVTESTKYNFVRAIPQEVSIGRFSIWGPNVEIQVREKPKFTVAGRIYGKDRNGKKEGISASVHVDLNADDIAQNGEPQQTANKQGKFSFTDVRFLADANVKPQLIVSFSRSGFYRRIDPVPIHAEDFKEGAIEIPVELKRKQITISGVISILPKGELAEGITVYIDRDANQQPDAQEPKTQTDKDGNYKLRIPFFKADITKIEVRAPNASEYAPATFRPVNKSIDLAEETIVWEAANFLLRKLESPKQEDSKTTVDSQESRPQGNTTAAKPITNQTDGNPQTTDTPVNASENNRSTKAQTDTIALLKDKGLGKGKDGWSPKELVQRLTTLKKEVENLQPDGLTPAQEKEVRELMNRYYLEKFQLYNQLHAIGINRGRADGFEDDMVILPREELITHRYLSKNLLAPRRLKDPPNAPRKLAPNAVMERDAEDAVIKLLLQKNPRYLELANVQRKKKIKQIKTLEKKSRIRIRSLQKEPEVQVALETLGSKFDPRFAPK